MSQSWAYREVRALHVQLNELLKVLDHGIARGDVGEEGVHDSVHQLASDVQLTLRRRTNLLLLVFREVRAGLHSGYARAVLVSCLEPERMALPVDLHHRLARVR